MRFRRALIFTALCLPVLVSACVRTTYRDTAAPPKEASLLERPVAFHLNPAYYENPPSCAAIRTLRTPPRAIRRVVEDAVERHLATRLPRVIGAVRVRRAESRLAVDLTNEADRRAFARQTRCPAMVEIELHQINDDYAVLWAQRRIGITLRMTRVRDGTELWVARHSAGRSDGGLPISILSLPVSAARAALVSSDPELFASIADDAVRRVMKTLPDTRDPSVAESSLYN